MLKIYLLGWHFLEHFEIDLHETETRKKMIEKLNSISYFLCMSARVLLITMGSKPENKIHRSSLVRFQQLVNIMLPRKNIDSDIK